MTLLSISYASSLQLQLLLEGEEPCRTKSKNRDDEVAPIPSHIIIMQEPAEEVEASIPTENVRDGPNLNRAFTVRRKAAKRTFPWDLAEAGELNRVPPSQTEGIPVKKKPRLEEPFSASTDESAPKILSHDTSLGLLAADAGADHADADTDVDPVKGHWRLEEDAKLNSAVKHNVLIANFDRTPGRTGTWTEDEVIKLKAAVKTYGDKDWGSVAALVPGRTRSQCLSRWKNVLDPNVDGASGHTGKWTEDEVIKLKAAVQMHGGKDWAAIATLVPGRTRDQCWSRWKDVLDPNNDRVTGRTGKWTAVEDSKLKEAVQAHGGKNWAAIAALLPGRAQIQCRRRWHDVLDANSDWTPGRTGIWAADEVIQLKVAVQTYGDKNWGAVAAMVPGRTRSQCISRWKNVLDPNVDGASGRTGKWTEDEDSKLKDAVQTHGGKNWYKIASLVPGRTQKHCSNRWHDVLDPSINRANGRTGKWTPDEDIKLKEAVQTHGGKNWDEIAALIPGRTKLQCSSRWHGLDCSIDRANGRTGKWTDDEIVKLKAAVQTHGSKDWVAISALVPGRTKKQCWDRWKKRMDPNDTTYLRDEVKSHALPVTMSARSATIQTYGYL
jgi:hypothetical protein